MDPYAIHRPSGEKRGAIGATAAGAMATGLRSPLRGRAKIPLSAAFPPVVFTIRIVFPSGDQLVGYMAGSSQRSSSLPERSAALRKTADFPSRYAANAMLDPSGDQTAGK